MGLAALHLTRRHKLPFSAAFLFISLSFLLLLLHSSSSPPLGPTTPTPSLGPTLSCLHRSFRFSSVGPTPAFSVLDSLPCGLKIKIKNLSQSRSLSLLKNSTVLFAGDSQSRLLLLSLLRLLLHPSSDAYSAAAAALSRRHSDFHTLLPSHSISLHFLWSPFESNISSSLKTLPRSQNPDLLITGSGLWHMLHVTNPRDYGDNLRAIRRDAAGIRSRMFWVGMPMLVEERLNTEEKRRRMNSTVVKEYEKEVEGSGILRRFSLLDVGWLSRECGARCTEDGMHYDDGFEVDGDGEEVEVEEG